MDVIGDKVKLKSLYKDLAIIDREVVVEAIIDESPRLAYCAVGLVVFNNNITKNDWKCQSEKTVDRMDFRLGTKRCLISREEVWNLLFSSFFEDDDLFSIIVEDVEKETGTQRSKTFEQIYDEVKILYLDIMRQIYE